MNAHSVCNKASLLCQYITEKNVDVMGVTETWLKPVDQPVIAELTPPGYTTQHIPRPSGRGGGVAIFHRDSLQVLASSSSDVYKSFEYIERRIVSKSASFLFVVIYRPPPSANNSLTASMFIDEFSTYLENVLISSSKVVIFGDFNFHLECPSKPDSKKLLDLIDSAGMHQHVVGPTHNSGHTLDIILTRDTEHIGDVTVRDDLISDHYTLFFELETCKPPLPTKQIQYRKIKKIDVEEFKKDIVNSGLPEFHHADVDVVVEKYNSTLSDILDKHAPLKTPAIKVHCDASWINDEIKDKKMQKQKAE